MTRVPILMLALLLSHGVVAAAAAEPSSAPQGGSASPPPQTMPTSQRVEVPPRHVVGNLRIEAKVVLMGMRQHFPQESWVAVEQRVAAELERLGLGLVRVPTRAGELEERMAELGAQAASHRALAAIRVVHRKGSREVQLWVYDALTQKMLLRRTNAVESAVGADALVALRVVELLEASLVEIRMRRREQTATSAPRPAVPAPVEQIVAARLAPPRGRETWRATAGVGLHATIGGSGAVAGAMLGLGWRLCPWLALNGEAFISVTDHTSAVDPGGEADFRASYLRGGVELEPWSDARVSPSVGLSAGTLIAHTAGRAAPPATSRSDRTAVALLSGIVRARVRLYRALSLVATVAISAALPEIEVHLGDQVAVRAGQPLIDAGLGIAWGW